MQWIHLQKGVNNMAKIEISSLFRRSIDDKTEKDEYNFVFIISNSSD